MRRTRVDEVPQILNVIRGEMSVIGPRPEQVAFTEEFKEHIPGFGLRLLVKPGISGLAQLKLGYTDDVRGAARKLNWDMVYISRMGFAMECYIVGATFGFVMRRLARTGHQPYFAGPPHPLKVRLVVCARFLTCSGFLLRIAGLPQAFVVHDTAQKSDQFVRAGAGIAGLFRIGGKIFGKQAIPVWEIAASDGFVALGKLDVKSFGVAPRGLHLLLW